MPTLIDQRRAIPAPIHAVWAIIADSQTLPKWRVDCQAISILTARQFGVGMRRQCTPPQGKPKTEEITAWYEGLGYEYVLLDRRYRSWVGRVRLQSAPEGTIVQWTITYEMAGIVNRLLNMIGGKAQFEEDCIASLNQLRRIMEGQGFAEGGDWMRKRQTLQPVPAIVRSSTQPIDVNFEDSAADTKPRKPEGLAEAIAESNFAPSVKLPPGMPESIKATPPQGTPKVDISRLRYADEVAEDAFLADSADDSPAKTLPPPTDLQDTGTVSIWDVFGVEAPSKRDSKALNEIVKQTTGEFNAVEAPLKDGDTMTFSPLFRHLVLRVRSLERRPPKPQTQTPIRPRK